MRRAPIEPDEMPPEGRVGAVFELPQRVAHYLRDVLRLESGSRIELFDGTGRVLLAELTEVDADSVAVQIQKDRYTERGESPVEISLVQAIPKGKRWETVLEKATELGTARFVPLESKRTVVHISDVKVDRKLDRWQRVVDAAARQCQRTVTPTIDQPADLAQALELVSDIPSLVAHTGGETASLDETLHENGLLEERPDGIAVWIGPEGGFDEEEVARLEQRGAHVFHLGPRVLRAETAGIVAVSLLQAYLGDLS